MSDEQNITGEQALLVGRGTLTLPEVTEILEAKPELAGLLDPAGLLASVPLAEPNTEVGFRFKTEEELTAEDLQIVRQDEITEEEALEMLGAVRTPTVTETSTEAVVEVSRMQGTDCTFCEDKTPHTHEPQTNALGTHEFCPMKGKCNHFSRQHCEQAKLEADHRAVCSKGHNCDCFSPTRGIPQGFRGR